MAIQAYTLFEPTSNQTNFEAYALPFKAWFALKYPFCSNGTFVTCGVNEYPSLVSFNGINLQFHCNMPMRIVADIDVSEIFIINIIK
jgi:hypothetical protein